MRIFTGLSGRADYTRVAAGAAPDGVTRRGSYTLPMKISAPARTRAIALGVLGIGGVAGRRLRRRQGSARPCRGPKADAEHPPPWRTWAMRRIPRDMGDFVLAKINANPAIDGKATLVEFRQKSVAMQPLGDKMKSAVVEFEGVVTFSSDVSWSWQGPDQGRRAAEI